MVRVQKANSKIKPNHVDNIDFKADFVVRRVSVGDTIAEPRKTVGNVSQALCLLSRHGAPKAPENNNVERPTAAKSLIDPDDLSAIFSRADELSHEAVMGTPSASSGYKKKIRSNVGFEPEVVDWLKSIAEDGKHFSHVNSLLRAMMELSRS